MAVSRHDDTPDQGKPIHHLRGRNPWRHGCSDPHACGEALHKAKCAKNCAVHVHRGSCKPGCTKQGHACPKRPCPKDCVGHAHRCPRRAGGEATFRRRKGKKKPVLMCPPELLPELRQQKIDQESEKAKAGRWGSWDVVFSQANGSPLDRTEDWKEWKAILHQAGVHNGRLHDARHTAGALMAAQGIHVRVIQEMLGHARVTTTERYTVIASQLVQDAGNRLGSALWGTEDR